MRPSFLIVAVFYFASGLAGVALGFVAGMLVERRRWGRALKQWVQRQ